MFKLNKEYNILVSTDGTVIGRSGKILKPILSNNYHIVNINKKQKRVHRLVVETFISKIPEGYVVNHIDGDKLNNNLENLEIVTPSENSRHAFKTGLSIPKKGSLNAMSKLSLEQVLQIYGFIKDGFTNAEIAEKYNLHERYISLIRHGKRWKHLHSEYFDENAEYKSVGICKVPLKTALKILEATLDRNKTNTQIALQFEIDQSTVCKIRAKKLWKNLWVYYYNNATTIESTS